jgi:hypothetical protein
LCFPELTQNTIPIFTKYSTHGDKFSQTTQESNLKELKLLNDVNGSAATILFITFVAKQPYFSLICCEAIAELDNNLVFWQFDLIVLK